MASSDSARPQFAPGLAPGALPNTRSRSPAPGVLAAVPGAETPTSHASTSTLRLRHTARFEYESTEETTTPPFMPYSNTPPPFLRPPSLPSTRSTTPFNPPPPLSRTSTSSMGKEKSNIDIILDAPYLTLSGIGPDAEPTVLSGHVLLHLAEATDIKEITLQFRGKARIPQPNTDSLINSSAQTYTFCNHDWSFLEGSKRHTRTLKAGRHIFPFSLTITGSLPSSLTSHPLNLSGIASTRATISYKLRAVASRPGLSLGHGVLHNVHMLPSMHNFVSTLPVHIVRKLPDEALEYQQTLEIENTWPDKLMYAILLPHKAWAAGDTLVGVLKLSPLIKGVKVESVVTALWEQTKVCTKSGVHDDKRIVKAVKHEIIGGRAVEVELAAAGNESGKDAKGKSRGGAASNSNPRSGFGLHLGNRSSSSSLSDSTDEEEDGFENNDVVTVIKFQIPPMAELPHHSSSNNASTAPSPTTTSPPYSIATGSTTTPSTSTSSAFAPTIQSTVTPSHTLDPIVVSHRIRWSIYIRNRDGHTSELRCSLPVHIMDGRLLKESRSCSVRTRRMVLESVGFGIGPASGGPDVGYDEDDLLPHDAEVEDRELPSYTAHVRDRVANMYMPEAVTVRVPWSGIASEGGFMEVGDPSPGLENVDDPLQSAALGSGSLSRDEMHPLDPRHRPASDAVSSAAALEYVNSELLARTRATQGTNSPERRSSAVVECDNHHHHHHGKPFSNFLKAFTSLSHGHERKLGHHHGLQPGHGHGHRLHMSRASSADDGELPQVHSFASSPMVSRPPSPGAPQAYSSTSTHSAPTPSSASVYPYASTPGSGSALGQGSGSSSVHSIPTTTAMVHRALTEVPDYAVASRGFMGGVPPLSSMHGLPSYEEASRAGSRQGGFSSSSLLTELVQEPESISEPASTRSSASPSRRSSLQRAGRSRSRDRRETMSDSDLVTRFSRAGVAVGNPSILQQLDSDEAAEDDDGIQMRVASRVRT